MNYRLLRVETNGRISEALIVDAVDDQAALQRAQSFGQHQEVEIWCGTRHFTASQQATVLNRPAMASYS